MFIINDRVQALDDDFEGVVVAVYEDKISVKDSDGFILHFRKSELIKIANPKIDQQLSYVPQSAIAQKTDAKVVNFNRIRTKDRDVSTLEVDLHIHKITDKDTGMSNFDMLNLQIDTAKRQLEFAIHKKIQRIIFIHGVGQGVLREELYTLFRRYDNLKFYDANFQKYGVGATEVYIYQNPKN